MTTDSERREVARRLREANVRRELYSPWCRMVESVLDGIDCGEDDGTCDENACCERFMKRMADLIEPAPPHCIAEVKISGDELEGCVNRAITEYTGIDRDALLALADEFDAQGDHIASAIDAMEGNFDQHDIDAMEERYRYARRIREALGVER